MSVEKGGRATWLGDSYEQLFATEIALDVITGKAISIQMQPIGEDEKGVDIWITYPLNKKVAVQLKRQHLEQDYWTPSDLEKEKILSHAKFQLERDPNFEFWFVSSCKVQTLKDLRDRLRRVVHGPDEFLKHHINTHPKRKKAFEILMNAWDLDPHKHIGKAIELLRKISFIVYDYSKFTRDLIENRTSILIEGNTNSIVASIGDYLSQNIGTIINATLLRQHLRDSGFSFRQLAGEPSLQEGIEDNQDRFARIIRNNLIMEQSITRTETTTIIEAINSEEPPQLIIVHGEAGCGKSVVLYQVFEKLLLENIPVLPIDLKTRRPEEKPESYGQRKCNLPSSPAITLEYAREQKHAVLIYDQMDSLRYNTTHSEEIWSYFQDLLKESVTNKNITTIVATRSIDYENDPHISEIKKNVNHYGAKKLEFKINDFDKEDVIHILSTKKLNKENTPHHQIELLKKPFLLHMWLDLSEKHNNISFTSSSQLIDKYFTELSNTISKKLNLDLEKVWKCINSLSEYLDSNGVPGASRHFFESAIDIIQELAINGIVYLEDNTVFFSHQSYLDYLVAKKVFIESTNEGSTPQAWLLKKQGLFRREQLRQLLYLLRDSEQERYENFLSDVLLNPETRFHIKHLIWGFLKHVNSIRIHEINIIRNSLTNSSERTHIFAHILNHSTVWFDALNTHGVLPDLIEKEKKDIGISKENMWFLQTITKDRPNEVDKLLQPFWRNCEQWEEELISFLTYDPNEDSPEMKPFRLKMLNKGRINLSWYHIEVLAKTQPEYAFQIAKAILDQWFNSQKSESKPKFLLSHSEVDDLTDFSNEVKKNSAYCWNLFREIYLGIKKESTQKQWTSKGIIPDNDYLSKPAETFVDQIMMSALQGLAATFPALFIEKVQSLSADELPFFEYKIMKSLEVGCFDLADFAIDWVCKKQIRFSSGNSSHENKWDPACRIVKRFSTHCSEAIYNNLETFILGYHDDWEIKSVEIQLLDIRRGRFTAPNEYGRAQNHLLNSLPEERKTKDCTERTKLWVNKFGNPGENEHPQQMQHMRRIHSPIPAERVHLVSDKNWIDICARNWHGENEQWKDTGRETYSECSSRFFSESLESAAKLDPVRFAKLATRLPQNADSQYFAAIISGIHDHLRQTPSENVDPIFSAQLEQIADHLYDDEYSYIVKRYCMIVEEFEILDFSSTMHDRLIRFSSNPNPLPNEYAVHSSNGENSKSEPDIAASAINCARGAVSSAIASLLSRRPELIQTFLPTIRKLLFDKNAAVQHEAFRLCLAVYNHDETLSIELAIKASAEAEDVALESHWLQNLIGYARFRHMNELNSIIMRMLNSKRNELAKMGALWSTVRFLETKDEQDLFNQCKSDSKSHRSGKTEAAFELFRKNKETDASVKILIECFNDEEKEIRRIGSRIFLLENFFDKPNSTELAILYSKSRAFYDDPDLFLNELDSSTERILEYRELILRVLDQYLELDFEECGTANYQFFGFENDITSLLFKLYRHAYTARNKELQNKCLDLWDALLQKGGRLSPEFIDCI